VSTVQDADADAVQDADPIEWNRVDPKYVIVDVVGYLISGVFVVFISLVPLLAFQWEYGWIPPIVVGALWLTMIALTPRRVRAIGYALRADDLVFKRGIMWQRVVAVPYGRMQLVDINRGPVARAVKLSELKFVTAAASSGVVIPGLPEARAEELRDQLVTLAESRRVGL
jgi:uncharacterized protein